MSDGAGRPRRYKTAKDLEAAVAAYFEGADKPTMSGLAYDLGFEDREGFSQYAEYGPEYSRTVKRARLRIEQDRHERLIDREKFTAGVIFDLKNNHGWKDKSEQEFTGSVEVTEIERAIRRPAQAHD